MFRIAPIASAVNPSPSASTHIVFEALEALTGDKNPSLPSGPVFPPSRREDGPPYTPTFQMHLPFSFQLSLKSASQNSSFIKPIYANLPMSFVGRNDGSSLSDASPVWIVLVGMRTFVEAVLG